MRNTFISTIALVLFLLPLATLGERKQSLQTTGTFKIEDPLGEPVSGMELLVIEPEQSDDIYETDSGGVANVTFMGSGELEKFVLQGKLPPLYQNLYIFGILPGDVESFQYTTFIGTRSQARIFGQILDLPYNRSNAYVVVGIDTLEDRSKGLQPSNLKPAVGASAIMEGDLKYGDPFIFNPRIQQPGNTIEKHGSSWITYPDVEPGEAEIVVTPPEKSQCGISPAFIGTLKESIKIKTYPDSVTIVSFVCTGGM